MTRRSWLVATVCLGVALAIEPRLAPGQGFPELVGSLPFGPAHAVAVSGTTAYLGSGAALLAVDVSIPSAPAVLGAVDLPDIVQGVAVAGSYAYVANAYSRLRVVDVSDPAAPVEVGFHDTQRFAWRVAVAGAHAYVADRDGGLVLLSNCMLFYDGFESGGAVAWSLAVP